MLYQRMHELEKILNECKELAEKESLKERIDEALNTVCEMRRDEMEHPKQFNVKHYVGNEHPSLRGLGFDIFVAEEREEVELFAKDLNRLLARVAPY